MKIKSYKEVVESFYKKITIWRRLSLIELLLILGIISMTLLATFIFKLATAGKLTWEHVFWFSLFFR
ncbi:hypothetical protein PM10SUCC1_03020 [Propionigenium maris DSM 9537]|uniref:Uncharacterized protein n=1 Tax=Propionigenium maris DSM 9537 TaxID=1123000 RepID=A0A9W6GIN7_9FUSO|nr:hypothetical protein PM10SUCC1_03020 [Propionigenium maris DSM 9537]